MVPNQLSSWWHVLTCFLACPPFLFFNLNCIDLFLKGNFGFCLCVCVCVCLKKYTVTNEFVEIEKLKMSKLLLPSSKQFPAFMCNSFLLCFQPTLRARKDLVCSPKLMQESSVTWINLSVSLPLKYRTGKFKGD